MSTTRNIVRTYHAPGAVMRSMLALGPREDRALAYLMIACVLIFVAQWPRLARQAALDDTVPFEGLLAAALFGWLFVMPLFSYALAAVSHLIAKLVGGVGTFYTARLALFWSLLATTPVFMFSGLAMGFGVSKAALNITGSVTAIVFVVVWMACLWAAERPGAVAGAARAD